jgi:hypothetical protein
MIVLLDQEVDTVFVLLFATSQVGSQCDPDSGADRRQTAV